MAARRSRQKRSSRSQNRSVVDVLDRFDRLHILMFAFILLVGLIVLRLFTIQIWKHSFYEALASDSHSIVQQLLPKRGEIYAKDPFAEDGLALITTNQTKHHVYANPKQIDDPRKVANAIAPILSMDPEVVYNRVSKEDDVYEPLKHAVTDQEIEAIEALMENEEVAGIHWIPEEGRLYPEGEVTSSLTGFVGVVDDQPRGQYGLEGYFDSELAGAQGSIEREQDAFGRFIAVGEHSITQAQDGDTIVLTIDKNIQYKACSLLSAAVEKHQADKGTIIVADPSTGAIMAMCDAPQYDPNNYSDVEDIQVFSNDAVGEQYEPGSVMKTFALAAAIDAGKITPHSTYEDTGVEKIAQYSIHNSDKKSHGVVDMTYVLEYSLNTGSIWAARQVGNLGWYDYLDAFGFGKRTGIQLSGENPGDISAVTLDKDIYTATTSFGQGMTSTPLQLVQAYSVFANEGTMMKPYIVDRVVKSNGYEEVTQPVVAGQPVSAETARTVGAMLVRVVDGGHAALAAVDGYFVAGKTGTAQIPKEDGVGYHETRHKDTFVGFTSVGDPRAVILVKIDEPKDVPWSALSAAPVFGEMSQFLTNYLHIEPDRAE